MPNIIVSHNCKKAIVSYEWQHGWPTGIPGPTGPTGPAGAGAPYYSTTINFLIAGVYYATLPTGYFNLDNAGLICDSLTVSTTLVQPVYQIGIDANPTLYYGPAPAWELTQARAREILIGNLASTLPASVAVRFEIVKPATGASVYIGRGFVRGLLQ